MIEDAREIPNQTILDTTVCILGGGAVGITLARELVRNGIEVILLPGAGKKERKSDRDRYRGRADPPGSHEPLEENRKRVFGGTTTAWGGRCVPFDPIDFEPRSWIPNSGWPIGWENVQPFLAEAMKLCEAGDTDFDARSAFPTSPAMMGPNFDDPEVVTWPLEKWSPPTNFARKYGPELSEAGRCRILLYGQGVQVHIAENKKEIQEVEASSGNKKQFFVRAKCFVLACGGLENARLLLASNQILPLGIGNQKDQVGRYYQSHQFGVCGHAVLREPLKMVYDFERDTQGAYARRRFWMTALGQQSHKMGNIIGFFFRQSKDVSFHRDPLTSSLYLAKNCLHRLGQGLPGMKRMWDEDRVEMGNHLRVVFREAPQLVPQVLDLTKKRFFSKRRLPFVLPSQKNNCFPLYYQAEHAPTPESRLVLTPGERDDLGMPRLLVKVKFSELDLHTVRSFFRVFEKRMKASGAGEFVYQEEQLEQQFAERKQTFNSNAHHIGTTRMSDNPRTGVVDSNGRVHGISNLYVGGSSIYPTSGHANPTLLAVMLALRLAKKLLNECGK